MPDVIDQSGRARRCTRGCRHVVPSIEDGTRDGRGCGCLSGRKRNRTKTIEELGEKEEEARTLSVDDKVVGRVADVTFLSPLFTAGDERNWGDRVL